MGWQVVSVVSFILGTAAIPSLVTSTDGAGLLFKSTPNQESELVHQVQLETPWTALRSEHPKPRRVRATPRYPGFIITLDDAQAKAMTAFLRGLLSTFTQKPQVAATPLEDENKIQHTSDSGVSAVRTSVWLILNRVWLATSCQYPDEAAFKEALREVNTEKERISRILTNVDVKTPDGSILVGTYVATVKEVEDTLEAAVDTMTRVRTARQCNSVNVKQVTDTLEEAVREIIATRKLVATERQQRDDALSLLAEYKEAMDASNAKQAEVNRKQEERLGKLEEDLRAFLVNAASGAQTENTTSEVFSNAAEGSNETSTTESSSAISPPSCMNSSYTAKAKKRNGSLDIGGCDIYDDRELVLQLVVPLWAADIQQNVTDDLISVASDPGKSASVSDNLCPLLTSAYDNDANNTASVLDCIARLPPNISSVAVANVLPTLPMLLSTLPSLIRNREASSLARFATNPGTSDFLKTQIRDLVCRALLNTTDDAAEPVLDFIATLPPKFFKPACQPLIPNFLSQGSEHIRTRRTVCVLHFASDSEKSIYVSSRLRSTLSEAYANNPNNTAPILEFISKLPKSLAKSAYNHIFPILLPSMITSIRTKDTSALTSFASDTSSSDLAFDFIQTLIVKAYGNSTANFEAVSAFIDQLPNRFVKPACEILPSSTVSMWSKHVRSGDTACVLYTVNAVNSTVTANEIQSLIKDAYVNDVGNKDAVLRFIEKLPSTLAVAALEIISSNLLVNIENGGNTTDIVRLAANPSTYPFLLSRIRSLVSEATNETDAVLDFIEALPDATLAVQAYETLLSNITPKKDPIRTLYQLYERAKKYTGSGDAGRPFSRHFLNTKVHPGFLKLVAGEFFNLKGYEHRGEYYYLWQNPSDGTAAFNPEGRGTTADSETRKQDKWLWQFIPFPDRNGNEFYIRNKLNKDRPFVAKDRSNARHNYMKLEPATPIILPTGSRNDTEIIIFMRYYNDSNSYMYWYLLNSVGDGGRSTNVNSYSSIGGKLNSQKWVLTFPTL